MLYKYIGSQSGEPYVCIESPIIHTYIYICKNTNIYYMYTYH